MVQLSTLLFALAAAGSVTAAPAHLHKRIAQVISDSTKQWEAACDTAGGGAQCNQIAVNAFDTLLAGAGPCDQQNNADIMMNLSKQLNSPDMIKFAQIFCQQPRNSPNSLSVVYCQQAPSNAELNGLFQCQFQGVDPNNFTNGQKVGAAGTIPFGQTSPVNPPGSCPANPSGPITAGAQLVDLVSSPGVPSGSSSGSGSDNSTAQAPSPSPSPTPAVKGAEAADPTSSSSDSPAPSPSPSSSSSGSQGFQAQNGKDAQQLNEQFKTLTADSTCTDGQSACINGDFAQCSGGKFVTSPCSGSTTCVALPLVNKPGTSVTCDTQADADARIATALGSN